MFDCVIERKKEKEEKGLPARCWTGCQQAVMHQVRCFCEIKSAAWKMMRVVKELQQVDGEMVA
jgi:hypothetical protein